MGWYYRKRKGPFNVSMSRYGPRVSIGFGGRDGCLLPLLLGVAGAWATAQAFRHARRGRSR